MRQRDARRGQAVEEQGREKIHWLCRRAPAALLLTTLALACTHGRPSEEREPTMVRDGFGQAVGPGREACAPPDPMPRVIAQSLRVLVFDGDEVTRSGSGVLLSSAPFEDAGARAGSREGGSRWRNVLVTNAHVVAPARAEENLRYRVILESATPGDQGAGFEAKLIALGEVPAMDLALLAFEGPALTPATLADPEELRVGAGLFAIAAPYGREISASAGILSRIDYERGEDRRVRACQLKTDASIGYGASGGGLFSRESGHLVGIIEGYRTAKLTFPVEGTLYAFDIPMPGETFAAPVEKLIRFVRESGFGAIFEGATDEAPVGARTSP